MLTHSRELKAAGGPLSRAELPWHINTYPILLVKNLTPFLLRNKILEIAASLLLSSNLNASALIVSS